MRVCHSATSAQGATERRFYAKRFSKSTAKFIFLSLEQENLKVR
jgi:hypothetical protein